MKSPAEELEQLKVKIQEARADALFEVLQDFPIDDYPEVAAHFLSAIAHLEMAVCEVRFAKLKLKLES